MLWTPRPRISPSGGSTIELMLQVLVVRVRTLVGVCLSRGGFVHCRYYSRVTHVQQPTA